LFINQRQLLFQITDKELSGRASLELLPDIQVLSIFRKLDWGNRCCGNARRNEEIIPHKFIYPWLLFQIPILFQKSTASALKKGQ
jgi:hypothetical protein